MMRNFIKLLNLCLVILFVMFFLGCEKGDKKAFDKAVELGRENNYTYVNNMTVTQNGYKSNSKITYCFTKDKVMSYDESGLRTYIFMYQNKYYSTILLSDSPVNTIVTSEEYNQIINNNIFNLLEYSDFEYVDELYVFAGDSEKKEELVKVIFDTQYKAFGNEFVNNFEDFNFKIKLDDNKISNIYVGGKSNLTTVKTIELSYDLEFTDYGATIIEIPEKVLNSINNSNEN